MQNEQQLLRIHLHFFVDVFFVLFLFVLRRVFLFNASLNLLFLMHRAWVPVEMRESEWVSEA